MTTQRILICVFAAILFAEAKNNIKKGDTDSICDITHNGTNKIQCYCIKDHNSMDNIRAADCSLTKEIEFKNSWWDGFKILNQAKKLTLTNSKGISLKYIPTNALKHTQSVLKLELRYGHVDKVRAYAFANLSSLRELILSDNRIHNLEVNAFANHLNLTSINLDKNRIEEVKRGVFANLPSLEKLFLTSNKIAIIHDKAFAYLSNLKELELNINEMISLNGESFFGLKKLQRLDLSSNNLEVLGDNTFTYLASLHTLNLEGNKIQMLDDRAFEGLTNLRHLSLAHNKLEQIDSLMLFQGLHQLSSLSLRANEFKKFPAEIMAPILENFYEANANLDVEDNPFSCYCDLIWFASLMNKTKSNNLKIAMDNIKCVPSAQLREAWSKIEEKEQNSRPAYENSEIPSQDYEYYDESQLNGKLFFTDIKDLLNCTPPTPHLVTVKPKIVTSTARNESEPGLTKMQTTPAVIRSTTAVNHRRTDTTIKNTSPVPSVSSKDKATGKSEEFIYFRTHKPSVTIVDDDTKEENGNRTSLYTTSRLATVSAKPIEETPSTEERMASDEAVPDFKTHRSVQQEYKSPRSYRGASRRNLASILQISMLLFSRVVY